MRGAPTVPLSVMGRLEAEVQRDLIDPMLPPGLQCPGQLRSHRPSHTF